jgi:hypothetical protein
VTNAAIAHTSLPQMPTLPCFCHLEPYHVQQRFDADAIPLLSFSGFEPSGSAAQRGTIK